MQTTQSFKKPASKGGNRPQVTKKPESSDRGTLIAFYVLLASLLAGLLYFISLIFFI